MDAMTSDDQNKLISSIEEAITLTHSGYSPNDAIQKVAKERQYNPERVKRMVEAFNKSKTVHQLKEASEDDRAKPFDIADIDTVLGNMFIPQEKVAESTFQIPKKSFASIDFSKAHKSNLIEKVASFAEEMHDKRNDSVHPGTLLNEAQKQAHIAQGARDAVHTEVQFHKEEMGKALGKVASYLQTQLPERVTRVSQAVINGYPNSGQRLLNIIGDKIGRPMPQLNKTANAHIFQAKEPFLSISKVYEHAEKMARAELERTRLDEIVFEKKAFLGRMLGHGAASAITSAADPSKIGEILQTKKKDKGLESELEPEYENRLKTLDARRNLMDLALYDDSFKSYSYPDIIEAYNQAVDVVPGAYNRPSVLKSLMVKNLQTGGLKDVHEITSEQGIQKQITKEEDTAAKAQAARDAARAAAKAQQDPVTSTDPNLIESLSTMGSGARGWVSSLIDASRKKVKEKEDMRDFWKTRGEKRETERLQGLQSAQEISEEAKAKAEEEANTEAEGQEQAKAAEKDKAKAAEKDKKDYAKERIRQSKLREGAKGLSEEFAQEEEEYKPRREELKKEREFKASLPKEQVGPPNPANQPDKEKGEKKEDPKKGSSPKKSEPPQGGNPAPKKPEREQRQHKGRLDPDKQKKVVLGYDDEGKERSTVYYPGEWDSLHPDIQSAVNTMISKGKRGVPFKDAAGNIIDFEGIPKIKEYYEKYHSPKSEDSDKGNDDLEKVVNQDNEEIAKANEGELGSLGAALEKAEKEKKDKDKEK